MKPITQVCVAIKFVGDASQLDPLQFEGTVAESFKFIGKTLLENTMKGRFDISVARNMEQAVFGVSRPTARQPSGPQNQEQDLDSMFASIINNSTIEED